MLIKDMFAKNIERDIRGVIKADQTSDDDVYQELEEYVVTRELHKHFAKFYENYLRGIDGETDKVGVWISGFFGSGKSHFLKILSYLLENKEVKGKRPTAFFEDKIEDQVILANMNRTANIPTETILFNIDSKSPLGNKSKEDAILRVLLKVFYDHQGYYGDNIVVAELEKYLDDEGYLAAYKTAFEEAANEPWESRRHSFHFDGHYVKEALLNSTNMTEASIDHWLTHSMDHIDISIEKFAQDVKEYIDKQAPNFHLVFLIDEVGQYIGDRRDLMLNLQTVTENLGAVCQGQAWMMVTSQESIDTIVKVRGDDFSRIQGRFDTRLSMSSISVDEVIQKRILEKKDFAAQTLQAIYPEKSPILRNVISFRDSSADLRGFADATEFAEVYPFIPYQFKLLQNVFEQVRRHGSSGKHLSEGERSMLSAYREAGVRYMEREEGTLIPFHAFYDTIREFLQPTISRVIEGAAENPALKDDEFHLNLLKVLFMVKYVKELPANIDNIATLMVSHIDEDKLQLREKIQASLQKLISQTLIQKNGEHYIFLTDDEQDINREIKQMTIEEEEVKRELSEVIFDEFYAVRKYAYSKIYDFSFNRVLDERNYGTQTANIALKVLSPLSEFYEESEQKLAMMTSGTNDLLVRLENNGYLEEVEEAIRIHKYREKRNISQLPENIQNILNNKQVEIRDRKRRAHDLLKDALKNARFFMQGNEFDIKGASVKEKLDNAFQLLVENIFTYLPYVKEFTETENELRSYIGAEVDQTTLLDTPEANPNMEAKKLIHEFIELQEQTNTQVRVKPIYDRFTTVPYGWKELDIAQMLVELLKEQKIRIRYNSEYLEPREDTKNLMTVFTNTREADKGIITIRKQVDQRLLRNVKDIMEDLFDRRIQASDEDGLITEIRELMDGEKQKIATYKLKYTREAYPGMSLLNKGLEYFEQFNKSIDNITYFKLVEELEDNLIDWFEDIESVKEFFDTNHQTIFDSGLDALEKYEDIKMYLDSDDVLEAMTKLGAIIDQPIPYKEIKHIPELVNVFETEVERMLEAKKQEAKEKIDRIYNEARLLVQQPDVSDEIRDAAATYYTNMLSNVTSSEDMYKVDAMVTQSDNYLNQTKDRVAKEIERARLKREREAATTDRTEAPTKVAAPVIQKEAVKITELIPVQSLTTEADVDNYVATLSHKLKEIIKSNKQIEFIE